MARQPRIKYTEELKAEIIIFQVGRYLLLSKFLAQNVVVRNNVGDGALASR